MRILYGVVGEGMGHATRSALVIEHLLGQGHEVRVVVSGRAHGFLQQRFGEQARFDLHQIEGLELAIDGMEVDLEETVWENLEHAPAKLLRNLEAYTRVVEAGPEPDLVISDFESWAYLYARNHFLPVVSIDNMQVLNRCRHPAEIRGDLDFQLAKLAVKVKLPGAYHYLVTSFFFPTVRKARTTLVPPILRPEILAAHREPGEHVLVYQAPAALEAWLPVLRELPYRFRVYGLGREGSEGNLELRPFSSTGFIDDLRTARAVVAGGGFSLMSEAVHLGVPFFAVPLGQQFEQELNARYLDWLGYGAWAPVPDPDRLRDFLASTDDHAQALERYPRQDNSVTLRCVDELIRRAAAGEGRPKVLLEDAMGHWEGDR
jgi:uncharacterized protein (TIGR00661 family)